MHSNKRTLIRWTAPLLSCFVFLIAAALILPGTAFAAVHDDDLVKVFEFGPERMGTKVAGVGMVPTGSGTFTVDVPGEVIAGFFYILSHEKIVNGIQFGQGDPDVDVTITDGNGIPTVFDTVPVEYMAKMPAGHKVFVNTMEVTDYISEGTNTFDVSGMDVDQANGASVLVVYRDASQPCRTVVIKQGCDFGFYRNPPPPAPTPRPTSSSSRVLMPSRPGPSGSSSVTPRRPVVTRPSCSPSPASPRTG